MRGRRVDTVRRLEAPCFGGCGIGVARIRMTKLEYPDLNGMLNR